VLRRCRVHGNGAEGVRAEKEAAGTVENCDLAGNGGRARWLDAGAKVRWSGNKE
jgi:hypothetical protein